jgi:CRP/FNR family transcriptional regulator
MLTGATASFPGFSLALLPVPFGYFFCLRLFALFFSAPSLTDVNSGATADGSRKTTMPYLHARDWSKVDLSENSVNDAGRIKTHTGARIRGAMEICSCHIEDCLLCEAQFYQGLSHEQVCAVRGLLSKHDYDAHAILFREGEASSHLYLVREGLLKLTAIGPDGREQIIGLGVAGQLLGFNTASDRRCAYTAETLIPTRVCKLRHTDMLKVLEQNPPVALHTLELLNQELGRAQALIRLLGQKTSSEKVASFLLALVPPGLNGAAAGPLPLPLSRQEIGEMLGLTVETVSRLMSEFKRERIIEAPRGTVSILDLNRLRTLAGATPAETGWRH